MVHFLNHLSRLLMAARRIFVSVSTKSAHWSSISESANVAVGIAMDLVRQKEDVVLPSGEPKILIEEKWGSRTHIVFDIFHDTYDPEEAHLHGRGDLPVIAVSLSGNEVVQVAVPAMRKKVNDEVREIHRLSGGGSRPPFIVDHSDGKIPFFCKPSGSLMDYRSWGR